MYAYILLGSLFAVLIAGIVIKITLGDYCGWDFASGITIAFSALFLAICLLILPVNRYCLKRDVESYKSFQETLHVSRLEDMSEIERAAIVSKIADYNAWLRRVQFAKRHWSVYVPDEVMELDAIQ